MLCIQKNEATPRTPRDDIEGWPEVRQSRFLYQQKKVETEVSTVVKVLQTVRS